MPLQPDLESQAFDFAKRTKDLLNRTVTDGVRLRCLIQEGGTVGWVGYSTNKQNPYPGVGIPLTLSRKKPRAFLHVMHTLVLDEAGRYLTAEQSSYGLYADKALKRCVFHYDYIRRPDNSYPPAHFQVEGSSATLDELPAPFGVTHQLGDLHFPVGGKRFRPSLEDIVEFLIVESIADARDGWEVAIEEHRSKYQRIQLQAAVRRDPEAAREALAEMDTEK